jgi:hypothetical protein
MIDRSSNVVPFDDLRRRRARFPSHLGRKARGEQRVFPRRKASDRLFVQIVASPENAELVGTTVSAIAVDMSASGLCFVSQQPFPVGTTVDLWVDVHAHPGKFFLAGEVRWNRISEAGTQVGVELRAAPASDISEWREFHLSLLVNRR